MKRHVNFIIVLVIVVLLCGCGSSKNIQNNLSNIDTNNNVSINEETDKSSSERAEIIKNEILKIPEVKSVTTVITGKSALIGLELNISYEDKEEVSRIKTETGKKARTIDKGIENTAITINNEIIQMIRDMEVQKEEWRTNEK